MSVKESIVSKILWLQHKYLNTTTLVHPSSIPKHLSSVTRVLNNSNLEPKEMSHLEPLGFQLPLVLVFKYHNGSVS